ncbi:MAG TPA: pilus assembly protein PilO [Candidatus Tenderia electrophaga]|uniref:Pilus assembly protein PilO n=1 Tax=Candidatus Tenderia electrophaga TaxID=1748243 RepID=A0A832N4Y1_9GAMM|nr:pilus assembly protein PilO [Candidatus Tenderia electrophaga]
MDFEQFKGLDPSDPGSWPVLVQAVAVMAVCLAVLGAGYWFLTQHQLAELEQAKQKEVELKDVFKAKQLKAVNLDAYKQQMADMERSFGAMLRQLPSKTEVAELLVDVSQAGLANGLEFELFKPQAEKPAEFYFELPINIKVTGRYHDFGAFVSDVAALPRIVTLHDIKISAKDDKLTMSTTAKTYRYQEDGQ